MLILSNRIRGYRWLYTNHLPTWYHIWITSWVYSSLLWISAQSKSWLCKATKLCVLDDLISARKQNCNENNHVSKLIKNAILIFQDILDLKLRKDISISKIVLYWNTWVENDYAFSFFPIFMNHWPTCCLVWMISWEYSILMLTLEYSGCLVWILIKGNRVAILAMPSYRIKCIEWLCLCYKTIFWWQKKSPKTGYTLWHISSFFSQDIWNSKLRNKISIRKTGL